MLHVTERSALHTSRYVAKDTTSKLASEKIIMRCKVAPSGILHHCKGLSNGKSVANSLRTAVTLTATSLSGGRAVVQSFNSAQVFENRDRIVALIGTSMPERS